MESWLQHDGVRFGLAASRGPGALAWLAPETTTAPGASDSNIDVIAAMRQRAASRCAMRT